MSLVNEITERFGVSYYIDYYNPSIQVHNIHQFEKDFDKNKFMSDFTLFSSIGYQLESIYDQHSYVIYQKFGKIQNDGYGFQTLEEAYAKAEEHYTTCVNKIAEKIKSKKVDRVIEFLYQNKLLFGKTKRDYEKYKSFVDKMTNLTYSKDKTKYNILDKKTIDLVNDTVPHLGDSFFVFDETDFTLFEYLVENVFVDEFRRDVFYHVTLADAIDKDYKLEWSTNYKETQEDSVNIEENLISFRSKTQAKRYAQEIARDNKLALTHKLNNIEKILKDE